MGRAVSSRRSSVGSRRSFWRQSKEIVENNEKKEPLLVLSGIAFEIGWHFTKVRSTCSDPKLCLQCHCMGIQRWDRVISWISSTHSISFVTPHLSRSAILTPSSSFSSLTSFVRFHDAFGGNGDSKQASSSSIVLPTVSTPKKNHKNPATTSTLIQTK